MNEDSHNNSIDEHKGDFMKRPAQVAKQLCSATQPGRRIGLLLFVVLCLVSCSNGIEVDEWEPWRTADIYPAWSPDSSTVAFIRKEIDLENLTFHYTLWRVDVSTGALTRIRKLSGYEPYGLTWDRKGDWLAFPTTTGIFKIKPGGDSLTQLTYGQGYFSPSWSHNGEKIFFGVNGGDENGLWSIRPDGSDLRKWNNPDSISLVRPLCFPDSDTLTVFSYEGDQFCLSLYFPGESAIAELMSCEFDWPATAKMLPGKARILLIGHSDHGVVDIFGIIRSSGRIQRLTSSMNDRGDLGFDFSPDGRYVVYPAYLETGGLAVLDLSDNSTSELTPGRDVEY